MAAAERQYEERVEFASKAAPKDGSASHANTLADAWTARHNLVLDPNLRPADALQSAAQKKISGAAFCAKTQILASVFIKRRNFARAASPPPDKTMRLFSTARKIGKCFMVRIL